jgi:hypothetical protein
MSLAVVLASCAEGQRSQAPLPSSPQVVTVTMAEFRYDYWNAGGIRGGRAVFRVRNMGRLQHEFGLYEIGDDVPPIDAQVHGTERRGARSFAGTARRPGGTDVVAVDLVPGRRYAILCTIVEPGELQSHGIKGMVSEFRAGPPAY